MAVKDIDQKTLYYIREQLADYFISKESADYYVTTNTPQIISGQKTFSSSILASSTSVNVGYSTSKFGYGYFNNQVWVGTGSSGSGYTQYEDGAITKWGSYVYTKLTFPVATTSTGNYSIALPAKSGVLALTDHLTTRILIATITGTGSYSLTTGKFSDFKYLSVESAQGSSSNTEHAGHFIPIAAFTSCNSANNYYWFELSWSTTSRWIMAYYVNDTSFYVKEYTGNLLYVNIYGIK